MKIAAVVASPDVSISPKQPIRAYVPNRFLFETKGNAEIRFETGAIYI